MRTARRLATIAATGLALAIANSGVAQADSAGSDYADHVLICQQEMGFSGTHNPGVMHQGFSGWDPSHTC